MCLKCTCSSEGVFAQHVGIPTASRHPRRALQLGTGFQPTTADLARLAFFYSDQKALLILRKLLNSKFAFLLI